jgi:hypothetical protein
MPLVRLGTLLVTAALLALATAAPADAAKLKYVISKQKPLPAGEVAFVKAKCPNDTKVTGGGIAILGGNTATAVRSSAPIDDGDGDEKPDDGWIGVALSRSAGNKEIVVVAVCSRSGRFSYVVQEGLMGPGRQSAFAGCPAGEPLAGGGLELFTIENPMNEGLAAASLLPSESGFSAAGNNLTEDFAFIRVVAICANSGSYEYVEAEDTAPDGANFGVAAACPNGTKVTSGGVHPDSASTSVEVARAMPYQDGGQVPDDGWQGTINNNNTGGEVDFSTWAVCRD